MYSENAVYLPSPTRVLRTRSFTNEITIHLFRLRFLASSRVDSIRRGKSQRKRVKNEGEHRVELLLSSVSQITSYLSCTYKFYSVFYSLTCGVSILRVSFSIPLIFIFERSLKLFHAVIFRDNETKRIQQKSRDSYTVRKSTKTSIVVDFHLKTHCAIACIYIDSSMTRQRLVIRPTLIPTLFHWFVYLFTGSLR